MTQTVKPPAIKPAAFLFLCSEQYYLPIGSRKNNMTSQTNVTTEVLRTLHRIHRQLSDLKERLARVPRLAQAYKNNLDKLEAQMEAAKKKARAQRVANDAKQLHLTSGEDMVKKRQMQLRQAGDNREYQALKDQIDASEMANSVLADEILEGMEKLDELTEKRAAAEAAVEKAVAESQKSQLANQEEQPLIEGDIRRLEKDLKEAEGSLPGDYRELYYRLVARMGEDALVPLNGYFCGGCNQKIPVNTISGLMLSRPIACMTCGRLLYLPEGYSLD